MRLDRFLESRLSCSARTVRYLFAERRIRLDGVAVASGDQEISKFCLVEADGRVLQSGTPIHLMMHKPRGCVSATSDRRHPTVLDLIDLPGKERLHLAGRLDFNTTGLLLLTNNGNWSGRITLPQRKIPKTYRVHTRDAISARYVEKFAAGIHFRFENLTTLPAELKILSANSAELTLYEGRYHQVKRMFGFFGNEVIALHRLSVGNIVLDESLAPGEYRHLSAAEVLSVDQQPGSHAEPGRLPRPLRDTVPRRAAPQ
ncbi:MAG: pseudouridine synthase [Gammaproteobacteria bacterium]|jgi:16S rRNA pseudouridine516 synthase|nr:pseudouridine synthase [Gammaproteobacteria bacterium]MBP6229823.1 pseudouridine synthase [Pseudomonadales bacterium]MBK6583952.1 pseudouridine synthase [Gammaproteobacteria bacterium]MBK7169337.1 pseudouridine synthase [Gammaproteobacteria bacterium]MBK7522455.1 pseudouridine synthase [Gammaproteobacteria bacterium]